jgi:hypothetical protein
MKCGPVVALLFAASSALSACDKAQGVEASAPAPSPEPASATQAAAAADNVVVYYFHGNKRCRTCVGMQQVISQTVSERFRDQIASGALNFMEVNYEEPENKHFVDEYKLGFSTMVVAARQGQKNLKWENCDKVWESSRNPPALAAYTEDRVRAHLDLVKKR